MGTGRRAWIPVWIPILIIAFTHYQVQAQYDDQQSQYEDQQYSDQQYDDYDYQFVQQTQDSTTSSPKVPHVTIIPPVRTTLTVKAGNPAHNGRVCSTWGNFHFKTFDGDIYYFPGLCNYVFASHCKAAYEDFNIQIRRSVVQNATVISHVAMKLDGTDIELSPDSIVVNGEPVQLPYSHSGILAETSNGYLKISAKLGLLLMWNQEDGLLLELSEKYANQTCGLCGDFNGIPTYNEFVTNNIKLNPVQFGNLQKMDGPTEQCQDPAPSAIGNCSHELSTICQTILSGEAFTGCHSLVEVQDYIDACTQDLCQCDKSMTDFCICNTFAEYSRQCAHAGGQPLEWRTADLCTKPCPYNMQHRECGSACADTCTNPERSQLCEEHCTDGCFCPAGTVYDDINNLGCIALKDCRCTYKGDTYSPGASFASQCTSCTCTGGQWTCVDLSCPGICSIEGGSHISTFDEKQYSFFGDCSYVLTKLCDSSAFTVLGDIRKCGLTNTETCLKGIAVIIGGGQTVVVIKPTGAVYVNMILTQLPISAANITIFRPSSFFIIVQTNMGLQLEIQLVPIMQLFVRMDPIHKGQTCGLCGNFNSIQADDFKAISGVVEGTSAAFANTWKTQADCPNVKNIFENPCTLSIENEKYAQHWCGLLTDSDGPFQKCHSVVNPAVYHTKCMFDTCNCERSEDCMCAALSSYVRACAAKGVLLSGWRTNVCTQYQTCPKTLVYRYNIDSCQATCRALSEPDVTCSIKFTPVDGCTCGEGTYLDETGKCVPATSCPCYYKGSPLPSGEVVHENGIICTCTQGKLQCIGKKPQPVCDAPMVYFDCSNVTGDATGAECQKSCQTLDMDCYNTECVSGCTCPNELVSDGNGGCIAAEECPCIHNEATFKPGETIKVKCNTCTCKNRKWDCTNQPCMATCSVYGDGHYITFDGKRYSFSGDCEYTLVQDHCNKNSTAAGSFRVITENIPCGTTGTTCSKAIKVFIGNYELVLTDGKFEVIQRAPGGEVPYKVRYMGIYMVIDTTAGLVLMWDKKTSIFIKLGPEYEGEVCGLCGNYDGNDMNDFTTRSLSVVGDVLEFGNSWKVSPTCPDAKNNRDPCTANPYRNSWAQKQCSIINSQVFAACHSQVEPTKYYEACVSDACACDTGGDCECFCTAVAAYAQACNEAGICVSWRTPSICPLFCDYYNPQGECEWHYKPCGSPCMKTCRNPSGKCLHELQGLEGCYPKCPASKPYFDEDDMECVDKCAMCYDDKGKYYKPGTTISSEQNCQSCKCTMEGKIECGYDENECYCTYEGKKVKPGDVVYNTTDGIGGCITATCSNNGTIERNIFGCSTTTATPSTTFVFSTTRPAPTTTVPVTTTICVQEECHWSQWYDASKPGSGSDGDFDTFDNLRAEGYKVCSAPKDVQCRAEEFPNTPLSELGQRVECSKTVGLICYNKDQEPMSCLNYQIKILCCSFVPCGYTTASTAGTTTVPRPPAATTKPTTILPTTLPSTSTVPETTIVLTTTPETTSSIATTVSSTTETIPPPTEATRQTVCKPTCKWTEWYDVHFPTLDNKGDFETYDMIKAAGNDICQKPERIQCRAEKFPDKSIDEIGQIVQCNVSFGFVCRNEEQSGMLQMCFNYQIKVYCCEDNCLTTTPATTTTLPTTVSATPTPTTATPETTSTSIVTTKPKTTTTTTPVPATTTVVSTTVSETTRLTTTTPETTSTSIVTTKPKATTATTPVPATTTVVSKTVSETTSPTTTTPETTSTSIVTTKPKTTTTTTPVPATTTVVPTTVSETTRPTTTTPETTSTSIVTTKPKTTTTTTPVPATTTVVSKTVSETTRPTTTTPETTSTSIVTTKPKTTTTTTPVPATTTVVPTTVSETIRPTATTPETRSTSIVTTKPKTTTTTTPVPATTTVVSKTVSETTRPTTTTPETTSTSIVTTKPKTTTTTTPVPATTTVVPTTVSETTRLTTTTPETTSTSIVTTKPKTTTTTTPVPATTTVVSTTVSETATTTLTTFSSTSKHCTEEVCEWSQWYDISYPGSAPDDGDFDTFKNIRAKGYDICKEPKNVQCRAERFPNTPLSELEQTVICSKTEGLICYNKNQLPPICYNYEIRIECCQNIIVPCPTTRPLTTKPITTSAKTTTTRVTPAPETSVTTRPTTTPKPIVTRTATSTTTQEPSKAPQQNGTTTTKPPKTTLIHTSKTTLPTTKPVITTQTTTTKKLTTTVTEPTTTTPIPVTSTRPQPTTTETTASTSSATPEKSTALTTTTYIPTPTSKITTTLPIATTTTKEITRPRPTTTETTTSTTTSTTERPTTPTTTKPTTIPKIITTLPTTTLLPSPTATPQPTTTSQTTTCGPICKWSEWFDIDFPTSGPKGGDIETYNNIRAAGGKICGKPVNIQCRAESHPDINIDEVGQIIECDVNYGLVCKNEDQIGKFKLCFNYEIRVLCCEENANCPSPTTQTTTTRKPTTTVPKPITTTPGPITTPRPQPTTTATTTSTTTTTTATTEKTTTPTTTKPTTVPKIITTLPTTTYLPSPTTTPQPTTTAQTTTCGPICKWSVWFDVDFPTSGPKGGDIETYNNIRAAGGKICKKPVNIQCRAENHPDLSIDQVGQIVECDVNYGLVCKNEDQIGKSKLCFNYEIRVLCCEENANCPSPTTQTTTTRKPTTTVPEPITTTPGPITTPRPQATTTATTTSTTTTTTATTEKTTTPTTAKPTTIPKIITTLPTTTLLPSPTTTPQPTTTAQTTTCGPICKWSVWFDVDFPTSGPKGGDIETYNNIRAAGGKICKKPVNIQCRAESHPDLSIDQVGQIVECDVNYGLVCKNEDQIGKSKLCFNYEIRVLCCKENANCPSPTTQTTTTRKPTTTVPKPITTTPGPITTPRPQLTTTATTTSTTNGTTATTEKTTTPTTTKPTTVPKIITTLPTTTLLPSPTTTPQPTTTAQTTTCGPICKWSVWFDVDFPTSGPKGGDIETYNNIRAAGGKICKKPVNIQCRAESHPDLSIEQVGQIVECDVNYGLVCKNEDQIGKSKLCFNYEIRVLCCEENPNCPSPTTQTTTTRKPTTTVPKPITTTPGPITTPRPQLTTTATTTSTTNGTTATTEKTTTPTTAKPTTIPKIITTLPTTTLLPSPTTTPQPTTTAQTTTCGPICKWSVWFDVDFPTSGPKGGDIETYNNIRAAGGKICKKPVNIQCRAESHPDLSIDQVGQIVECDVNYGLVCKNEDQIGKYKLCFNYEIRVLCCEENANCPSPTTQTTTTRKPTTTVPKPITTTPGPITTPRPQLTTTATTTSTTNGTTATTEKTTTPTTTKPTTVPKIITTLPTTTLLPSPTTTPQPTTTVQTTTCGPICKWSVWFDVDFPTSGPKGGDIETYNNIRAAGGKICKKPVNIQCRAESHPDLSIEQVGQIVECDVNYGLVCKNEDQIGKSKLCFNYEIRVLCCEENANCPSPTTQTTTTRKPTTTVPKPITTTPGPITTPRPQPTTTATTTSTTTTTTATTEKITTPTTAKPTTIPKIITTLPTTTLLPSPTTTPQPTTTAQTTTCGPICKWSVWFDVDFPTSGPKGGDIETYNNIRAAGGKICKKPVNIQCRAESHPDLSIDQVGQIVECDVNYGLVCKNEDQIGKSKLCFNYEIRVLCCEENANCPSPTTQTTTTRKPTTTVPKPITTTPGPITTPRPQPTTTATTTATTTTTTATTEKITTPTTTKPTTVPKIITTLPTTTLLPSSTTTPQPTTTAQSTACGPICKWSDWFDVDFPTSGPKGGDIETYNNIRAAGGKICGKPVNIQCRAESHPDLSIDQVGQIVECDVNYGLVCKNEDQIGKSKLCYNYEIRVLCCEQNPNCLSPTSPTRKPTTTITEITTTISTTLPVTTKTTTPSSLSPCFCQVGKTIYRPGEIIYNKTDSDGCQFYAICSQACSVERFTVPCRTTPEPTSPVKITTPIPTTSTKAVTTPVPGCPDATPPRKAGETWISNCTKATCEGNNKIVLSQVTCPPVQKIVCENGYPPVKVFSEDGCCYHYECECVCSGWGDPHYITFDGTYYTFLDNCTYVLVQQITPKYDNFSVLINNYFCDAEDGLSCPQSIIIYYKSSKVVLTRELYNGVEANKILFNGDIVNPGFQKDGIFTSMLGINMVAEIPEIGASITFSGLIFSIKLPYDKFGGNTEGQCGTCTNNKTDECRLPTGEITDCPQMAPHWRVHDKQQYCLPAGNKSVTPAPPRPCKPTPLCQKIMSDIFSECHELIPPQPYFQGCVFDACHIDNVSMQCAGLEIYASLCASRGICVDWRAKTQGACPYSCPADKVYDPCGPINPPSCDPRAFQHSGPGITEGCFCREGTKLFNAYTNICVHNCSCTGPDGLPRAPGTTWTSNCQDCTCEKYSLTVQCTPKTCPAPPPVSCEFEGFIPVTVTTSDCCPQKECRCNTTYCPKSTETCPLGYELKHRKLPGDCCMDSVCSKLPGCIANEVFYKPGAVIPRGLCEVCKCSLEENPETKLYTVECVSQACDTNCPVGYAYKEKSGQCCGECTPVACVLKLSPNDVHVIQPGETWHLPGNNCTNYQCDTVEDQFVLVTVKRTCPALDPPDCSPEDIVITEDGCCRKCTLPSERKDCRPTTIPKVFRHNGCNASSPVELTSCSGNCDSSSIYSLEANTIDHTCNCCQELKTSKRQVALICPDGSTLDYSYIYVEECGCVSNQCGLQPTPTPGQQQQDEQEQGPEEQQQQQQQTQA